MNDELQQLKSCPTVTRLWTLEVPPAEVLNQNYSLN